MNYKIKHIYLVIIIIQLFVIIKLYNKKEKFYINPSGLNSFDKILYINLEHRKDRKKQILEVLKKQGVKDSRIKRIDAIREKYNGHIGCCKSHIKALEYAKQKKYNHVIIFEDDFVFTRSKKKYLIQLIHF